MSTENKQRRFILKVIALGDSYSGKVSNQDALMVALTGFADKPHGTVRQPQNDCTQDQYWGRFLDAYNIY